MSLYMLIRPINLYVWFIEKTDKFVYYPIDYEN